jgi:Ulp1 family protease
MELFYGWKLKTVVLRENSGAAIQIPNNFFQKMFRASASNTKFLFEEYELDTSLELRKKDVDARGKRGYNSGKVFDHNGTVCLV